jgi:hypothetical protein
VQLSAKTALAQEKQQFSAVHSKVEQSLQSLLALESKMDTQLQIFHEKERANLSFDLSQR